MGVRPDIVTLICDGCFATTTVRSGSKIHGVPVLVWWYQDRRQRCASCAPLADPSTNREAKIRSDARETSRQAALEAFPRTGVHRRLILDYIASRPDYGATDDEIIVALNIRHQSAGPRRLELFEGGWIEDSGIRRRTVSGKDAIVWCLTTRGRAQYGYLPAAEQR